MVLEVTIVVMIGGIPHGLMRFHPHQLHHLFRLVVIRAMTLTDTTEIRTMKETRTMRGTPTMVRTPTTSKMPTLAICMRRRLHRETPTMRMIGNTEMTLIDDLLHATRTDTHLHRQDVNMTTQRLLLFRHQERNHWLMFKTQLMA